MMIDTHALILRSTDSGETSRRLTVFSRDEGRFSLMVRGARGARSKGGGALEPYVVARVFTRLKPGADLATLREAETIERFPRVRSELERLAAAGVFCETLDRATPSRLANPRLYDYALSFVRALEAEPPGRVGFLLAHGLLRVIQAKGLGPETRVCVACGREPSGWLSFEGGGLMCGECARGGDVSGARLEPEAAALLRLSAGRSWVEAREAGADGPEVRALLSAVTRWVQYHLECELKSVRFFNSSVRWPRAD